MRARVAAVLAVVAAGCGGAPAAQQPEPAREPPPAAVEVSPATVPEPELPAPGGPRAYAEGDRLVLPVTFPDGTRADLVYPPALALHLEPVRASSWGELRLGPRAVQRDFVIYRAGEGWDPAFEAAEPTRVYEGQDGATVPFFDGAAIDESEVDYLVFRLGSWRVAVYDYAAGGELAEARMTEEERATWARSLSGRETEDGFLVLEASPPLRVAPVYAVDPSFLLSLSFGAEGRSVQLAPRVDCRPDTVDDRDAADGYAIWCLPEASMIVQASGKPRFVRSVLEGLEVRSVRPAP